MTLLSTGSLCSAVRNLRTLAAVVVKFAVVIFAMIILPVAMLAVVLVSVETVPVVAFSAAVGRDQQRQILHLIGLQLCRCGPDEHCCHASDKRANDERRKRSNIHGCVSQGIR